MTAARRLGGATGRAHRASPRRAPWATAADAARPGPQAPIDDMAEDRGAAAIAQRLAAEREAMSCADRAAAREIGKRLVRAFEGRAAAAEAMAARFDEWPGDRGDERGLAQAMSGLHWLDMLWLDFRILRLILLA